MEIIRTQSLMIWQGSFTLGPVHLQLAPGEILGIMGPKGAGKTTLLKLLWGFARPGSGTAAVFGIPPHLRQIDVRLRAGYLSDAPRFYRWMTARDFLKFISHFYPNWDESHVDSLLTDFDIDADRIVDGLSKSDKMKLALISALGHRPLLLLLDEPASGQDPVVCREILSFLKQLSRDENIGIVISSAVSDDLDRTVDTILMLNRGRVVHYAPSAELKKQYGLSSLEDIFVESVEKVSEASRRHNA